MVLLPTITSLQIIPFASVRSPAKPLRLRFVCLRSPSTWLSFLRSDNGQMLMLAPPSMSMCLIDIPSRCTQMKRGPDVRTWIFRLIEHDMFRTQCQLHDVFHWCTEFYRGREDHVESIGNGSSPCQSFSLLGLLLPKSGLRLPDSGGSFPTLGCNYLTLGSCHPIPICLPLWRG
jgi:hypothetical protein